MAEVVRVLEDEERGNYMPFEELLERQSREVYEAVGEHLMLAYEFDGQLSDPVDLLVELRDGSKVNFSYSESIRIDAIVQ